MRTKRHTVDLTKIEVSSLLAIAERCNAFARAGRSVNMPSWRTLLREIASGRIACRDRLKGGGK
jgi:hypothetical protein